MTGRMTFPKAESWWIKYPRLVLVAESTAADCLWLEVRCAAPSVAGARGTEGSPTGKLVPLPDFRICFFCLSRSSRILRC